MKVDAPEIRIAPATEDEAGNKLEPEQRPGELRYGMDLPLTLGAGPTKIAETQGPTRIVRGMAVVDALAGDIADSMRRRCADCKHFDRAGWMRLYKEWKVGTREQQQMLNQLRAAAEQVEDDAFRQRHMDDQQGEIDTDHVLGAMGVCHVLTDYWSAQLKRQEEILMEQGCSCPDNFGPDGTYLGLLFQPRDAQADKRGAQAYDKVMAMAQGRTHVIKPPKK